MCHMSGVTCQVSYVTCHVSFVTIFLLVECLKSKKLTLAIFLVFIVIKKNVLILNIYLSRHVVVPFLSFNTQIDKYWRGWNGLEVPKVANFRSCEIGPFLQIFKRLTLKLIEKILT